MTTLPAARSVEARLADVLTEFARTMLTEFPIQLILDRLVERIVEMLPITSAGVTLIAPGSDPFYVAASDGDALRHEHLQSQLGQGPCVEAYETGDAVAIGDLREDTRFPTFAGRARAEGLAAVFAFPLCQGTERIGALDLYRATPGLLDGEAMATAQTRADVAAAYLINAQARIELQRTAERTERLAAIVESSSDSIVSWTPDGVITSWNAGSERMYGHTAAEALGQDMSLIVPLDRRDEIERFHGQALGGSPVPPFETRKRRKDGSTVDVSVAVSPIRDATTAIVGVSAVARDITDEKHEAEVRRSLEDRLHQSERLESLGQLAGGVAHDFNNLLAVILNYATFVAEAVGDDEAVQHDVQQIVDATERAVRLTRQLLMFGRRETVNPESLALDAVVEEVRAILATSLGEHIALIVRPAADLPAIRADRGQVEQVLLNLAVNARDAMPQGGTLTIETTSSTVDDTQASGLVNLPRGRYVRLAVSDTGSGMSPAVVARAFEPFFTTKPKGEGTGLGLATVHGIVSQAGGALTVHSEPAVGTTFELYFPAAAGDVARPPVGSGSTPRRGTGATVLVVEDQEAVRAVIVRLLRRNGYDVLEAATGAQAIAIAVQRPIHLLLTDVVMPVMSGPQLAARLRGRLPGLPVLYMSGYPEGVLGPRRTLARGVALIEKPFVEDELLARVQDAIAAGDPPG
jgi:two-component system cell cycle sensor histidine kinase/response regulator CckA